MRHHVLLVAQIDPILSCKLSMDYPSEAGAEAADPGVLVITGS